MNISKFTQKSMQAVQDCEKLAYDYGHQELVPEHLLYSLLTMEDSLISKLFEKMEIKPEVFSAQLSGLLNKRPKVSKIYVSSSIQINSECLVVCFPLLIFSLTAPVSITTFD